MDLAHDYNPLDGEAILAPVTTPITPASPGNGMGVEHCQVMFVTLKLSVMTIGILQWSYSGYVIPPGHYQILSLALQYT